MSLRALHVVEAPSEKEAVATAATVTTLSTLAGKSLTSTCWATTYQTGSTWWLAVVGPASTVSAAVESLCSDEPWSQRHEVWQWDATPFHDGLSILTVAPHLPGAIAGSAP